MRDFQLPGRSPVMVQNGLCATSHPLAAQTAVALLQAGGNAVDAAIGAAMVLNVCEPAMTGLGGDMFALISPAGSDEIIGLNGSGRAPKALSAADLRDKGMDRIPQRDAVATTVPGAVDAFCRLSAEHGKMSLAEVLAPAIRYADAGVPVAPRTAFDWAIAARDNHLSGVAKDFYLTGGTAPKPGEVFRAPGQAEVLRRIAAQGRAGFYEGEVAEDMVASLNALGGVHTLEDFAATACDYMTPISGHYAGLDLVEMPPNGQGATAILMNNILSHFDMASLDPFGAQRTHLEAEATKLAYDARNRIIADPSFTARLDHMLSPETASKLAALIDPKRAMGPVKPLTETVHRETVYLTVVDKDRMAVSLIYSIYSSFGTGLASDKFGLIFQNRGAGFTLEEGHPNEAQGGKRPMHTIIPGMLKKDGKLDATLGVMGGAYQPTGHCRMVNNLTVYGMSPQEALDAPRSFTGEGPLELERGYGDSVRAELAGMGHKIETPEEPIGGGQMIRIHHDTGVLEGGSDPRKDGCAIGY